MVSGTLVDGVATGVALVLDEPVSFWGGLDAASGVIVDQRHPQAGVSIRGRVVVMPEGRGSSSSSAVIAEAIRAGQGPAAIVLRVPDHIVALGAFVAAGLYDVVCPVVVTDVEIADGAHVSIAAANITITNDRPR